MNIKECFWKRLQSWKVKILSAAGKKLLIKSIAVAIPIYTMNCFLLPKYFCDDLNHLIASFWWNDYDGGKRIHWLSWNKLCIPKAKGVLSLCVQSQFIGETGMMNPNKTLLFCC